MKVKAIISALMLMACGMASAQTKTYLNVETAPGVYKSFEVNENLKISWGEKKELPPSTGTAKRTGDIDVNWVQLWKDGPKFAEYNIGATSATDYGGYYTWGGTYANGKGITWTDDHNKGDSNLSCTGDNITDTATNLWGENWRMPTEEEFSNLLAKCDVKWIDGSTEKYNNTTVTGLLCTGRGAYSSNSVFLPAAGYNFGGDVSGQGDCGVYWSSTPKDSDIAYDLYFDSGKKCAGNYYHNSGYSVRAVLAE